MIRSQKFSRIRLSMLSSILLVGILLLAACQPTTSASSPTATVAAAATSTTASSTTAPTDTQAPTTAASPTTAAATATGSAMTATPMAATATGVAMTATPMAATATASGPTPTAGAVTPMTTTTINVSTANTTLGNFLVDANNMTLYIFKNDTADTSTCTAGCLTTWPALSASGGTAPTAGSGVTGTIGVITRADGIMQVTYNHQPLYYYKADLKPGDTNGQGLGNKWYVVAP